MTDREKLQRLAQDIEGLIEQERILDPIARTISPELGEWFVKAVNSADPVKALGLTNGRGRPTEATPANLRWARKAFSIKRAQPDKTFAQISSDIGAPGDGDWLRGEYFRFKERLTIEYWVARLAPRSRR